MVYWETVTYRDQQKKFSSFSQWRTQIQNLLCQLCGVLSQTTCSDNTYSVQLGMFYLPRLTEALSQHWTSGQRVWVWLLAHWLAPLARTHWIPGYGYVAHTVCTFFILLSIDRVNEWNASKKIWKLHFCSRHQLVLSDGCPLFQEKTLPFNPKYPYSRMTFYICTCFISTDSRGIMEW